MSTTPKSSISNGALENLLSKHVPSLANMKYHNTDNIFLCTEYHEFLKGVATTTPRLNKSQVQKAAENIFGVHPREAGDFAAAMVAAFRHAVNGRVVDGTRTSKYVMGIREASGDIEGGIKIQAETSCKRQYTVKEEQIASPPPKRMCLPVAVAESPGRGDIYKLYNGRSPTPTQREEWNQDGKVV